MEIYISARIQQLPLAIRIAKYISIRVEPIHLLLEVPLLQMRLTPSILAQPYQYIFMGLNKYLPTL
jgi:hypothetical protein